MTVKSGLEKIFLKFLHAQSPFMESIFTKKNRGFFHKIVNSVIKSIFYRDFNEFVCDVFTYNKWNFMKQISSIFNFEHVNEVWITGLLGVKDKINWVTIELLNMALPVMEFQDQGYKIRKVFA